MTSDSYRRLIWHGAIIFLLANVTGWILLLLPLRNPRMMLATHTAALFGALLMIAIGMLGPQLDLGLKARGLLFWSVVLSQYCFVLAGIYAAFVGTSSMFASPPDLRGTQVQEAVSAGGNAVGIVGSTLAALILVWGLRTAKRISR
jgi:hypothetical protein